jgi:hypothetical protein
MGISLNIWSHPRIRSLPVLLCRPAQTCWMSPAGLTNLDSSRSIWRSGDGGRYCLKPHRTGANPARRPRGSMCALMKLMRRRCPMPTPLSMWSRVSLAPCSPRDRSALRLSWCASVGRAAVSSWATGRPKGTRVRCSRLSAKYAPPPPLMDSPVNWGDDATVRERFRDGTAQVSPTPWFYTMTYPFAPAEVVEFFREYYGRRIGRLPHWTLQAVWPCAMSWKRSGRAITRRRMARRMWKRSCFTSRRFGLR